MSSGRLLPRLAVALGLLAAPVAAQPGPPPCRPCVPPLDLTALVPPPPGADDPRTRQDLDALRARQAARTPEDARAARADVDESVFLFADVLGPAFDARRLPRTADLFARLGEEASAAMNRAKATWDRSRPNRLAPDLVPCLPVPATSSYPSGHALLGMFYAAVLGQMLPERRADLFARARRYAEHRETCGLHYPSDTEAGYASAAALAGALAASAGAAPAAGVARAELRPALGLPPDPPAAPAATEPAPSEDFRVR